MGFRTGAYAKIWNVDNKGKYSIVELSTSRKDKSTDKYETDFSSKFVRFIGDAHTKINSTVGFNGRVKIESCDVTTSKQDEKYYTNFLVFDFEMLDSTNPLPTKPQSDGFMNIPTDLDEELPFN